MTGDAKMRTARCWLLGIGSTAVVACSVYEPKLLPAPDAEMEDRDVRVIDPGDGALLDGDASTARGSDAPADASFDGVDEVQDRGPDAPVLALDDARTEAEAAAPVCDAACMLRCTDRVMNGTETRIDCGGGCPPELCPPLPAISNLVVNDVNLGQDSIPNNVQWSIESAFADGQTIYGDRATDTLAALPPAAAHLAGKPWIKTAADSKLYSGSAPVATATISGSFVFIAMDDRQTTSLSAEGYVYQFYKLSLNENEAVRTLSVWRKPIASSPSTIAFPSVTSVSSFYLIVVE